MTLSSTDLPYRPCAGILLLNAKGLAFAGERIDTPGAWQMPQGGIDPGETPRDAALRELEEEAGVKPHLADVVAETPDWLRYDLPDILVGKVWGGRWRGQEQKWILARFLGSDADIRIDTDHPEFSRWDWIPPSELPDRIVPFKRAVYRQVIDSFSEYL
ncbi:RNA pyrophosphohydrolase [Tropicimonas sp. IMCC34011]|uniref:RNA pyrophosphohydrolase n=1 Tax=Tropicimonas sp. IMCC34011 TaxID=2248759 RepID=UPI000E239E38|nr:RNA pyrophosphohydrolase [Tropicimonas sp. IMCC34011]